MKNQKLSLLSIAIIFGLNSLSLHAKESVKVVYIPLADHNAINISIAPPKAFAFINKKNSCNQAVTFEQSLAWSNVLETQNFVKLALYSKNVLVWLI